jgi:hypothetical protein
MLSFLGNAVNSYAGARAESGPACQPRVTLWESRPLTTLRRPERVQAKEATPALTGRAGPLEAGFPGRCPGLMCPHAVGVQNVRTFRGTDRSRCSQAKGLIHTSPGQRPGFPCGFVLLQAIGLRHRVLWGRLTQIPTRRRDRASIPQDNESRLQRSEWSFADKPGALPWAGMNDAVGVPNGRAAESAGSWFEAPASLVPRSQKEWPKPEQERTERTEIKALFPPLPPVKNMTTCLLNTSLVCGIP